MKMSHLTQKRTKYKSLGIIIIFLISMVLIPEVRADAGKTRSTVSKNRSRWFIINVNSAADIALTVNWTDPSDSLKIELYDENQELIAWNYSAGINNISLAHNPFIDPANYTLKVIGDGVESSPSIDIDVACNFVVSVRENDEFLGYITQGHSLWYNLTGLATTCPLEISLYWENTATMLNVTVYDESGNSVSPYRINDTVNSTTIIFPLFSTIYGPYSMRINGTTISNVSTSFMGISNYPIVARSMDKQSTNVVIDNSLTIDLKITLDDSLMPAEIRIFWANTSDSLNLTFIDQIANSVIHSNWTTILFDGSPGAGVFQVRVDGLTIVSAATILFDVESNYPIEVLSAPFSSSILQGQEKWFMVTVDDPQLNMDVTISWNSASDDLDITLLDPFQEPISITRVETATSESFSYAPMWAETYYMVVYGKTVVSQTVIPFSGVSTVAISPMTTYSISGEIKDDTSTWFSFESNGNMEDFIDLTLTWDESSGDRLSINLYDEYMTLADTSTRVEAGKAKLNNDLFFPGGYKVEILQTAGKSTTINFKIKSTKMISIESDKFTIIGVTPDQGGNGGTVMMTVIGDHIPENATVKISATGGSELVGRDTLLLSPKNLISFFDLDGMAAGIYDVVVTLQNGTSQTLLSAFKVIDGGKAEPWSQIIGREGIRLNTNNSYSLMVGNAGDIDVYDVFVGLFVPKEIKFSFSPQKLTFNDSAFWQNSTDIIFEVGDYRVAPFWIYCLGANSLMTMDFMMNTNESILDGEKFQVMVCILPSEPNRFSQTGNFNYFNESTNMGKWIYDTWDHLVETGDLEGPVPIPFVTYEENSAPQASWTWSGLGKWALGFIAQHGLKMCAQGFKALACYASTYAAGAQLFAIGGWVAAAATLSSLVGIGLLLAIPLKPYGRAAGHWLYKWWTGKSALDPNEKEGPTSADSGQFIDPRKPLVYTIYAENLKNASLSAQIVNITDTISPYLNLSSFELFEMGISNKTIIFPKGLNSYSGIVDLRPSINVTVEVNISIDPTTRILTMYMRGLDPITGQLDEDGFLLPNVNAPEGEIHVTFSLNTVDNITSGTNITNFASIIFDGNAPIITNTWWNIVDSIAPSTTLSASSTLFKPTEIKLNFNGNDGSGSGVLAYTIYVSIDGGAYSVLIFDAKNTSAIFIGEIGKTYSFKVFARDAVGNYEIKVVNNLVEISPSYTIMILIITGVVALLGLAIIIAKKKKKNKSQNDDKKSVKDEKIADLPESSPKDK
jgi:hypothetical protein